jgi:hypothetical protein
VINQFIQGLYMPNFALPKEEGFYKQLIEYAERYAICSQIYHLLSKQEQLENTPLFFQKRLKQKYHETLYQNVLIKNQTDQLLTKFEEINVEVIPLKGVYFADNYFGHIGARWTSDIDLLIREENVEKAMECVKSLGFDTEEEFIPSHFHCSFSKEIPGSPLPLTVEIHWNILKNTTSNFEIERLWDEAVPLKRSNCIKLLSDYHTFYMICLHGWRHNLDSPKYFLDIIQLINVVGDSIDYSNLLHDAKNDKTLKRMIRTLSKVYREFPILSDMKEFPFFKAKKYSSFVKLMTSNNKKLKEYIDFVDYQFFSYDRPIHIMSEMYHWIIPKGSDLLLELHCEGRNRWYVINLLSLYKQRFSGAFKAMMKGV